MKSRIASLALVVGLFGIAAPRGVPGQDLSPLGTNLTEVCYWQTEFPFADAFKSSGPWISGTSGTWDDGRTVAMDDSGWVTELQEDQIVRTVLFHGAIRYPAGRYVVEYEGEGELVYEESARLVGRGSGRDEIEVDPSQGSLILAIVSTNPANYLRNIRIPLPGIEAPPGEIFNSLLLERNADFQTLRFGGWMLADGVETRDPHVSRSWEDRPKPQDARWSTKGVPVEVMVELANRLQADPWFSIPLTADDGYVANFAEYVSDHLDPRLNAYVESSNEVWNPVMVSYDCAAERGLELRLNTTPRSEDEWQALYEARYRYHVRRSMQVFDAFEAKLARDRLVRVLATVASGPDYSRDMLGHDGCASRVDALATGGYFGFELGTADWAARVRQMSLDGPRGLDALFRLLRDESPTDLSTIPVARQGMIADAAVAAEYGIPLVVYEGGQHLSCQDSANPDPDVVAFLHAANRDPRMGALYDDLLAAWSEASGGQLFLHFQDCAAMNAGGSWGALEFLDQPRSEAPKFDALMRWMEASGQAPQARTALPDLGGSWSLVRQTRVRSGRAIRSVLSGRLVIENHGTAAAGAFRVRVYRSADETVDRSDITIGWARVPSLEPGEIRAFSLRVALRSGASARGGYVLAVIDEEQVVEESDRENNRVAGPVR